MSTREIIPDEFPALIEASRSAQTMQSIFERDDGFRLGAHTLGGKVLSVVMRPPAGREIQAGNHLMLADVPGSGECYIWPPQSVGPLLEHRKKIGIKQPPFPFERLHCERPPTTRIIDALAAAALIHTIEDPARIVLYTGAGVSNGPPNYIPDHSKLEEELGLDADNHILAERILQDPSACQQVYDIFTEFWDAMYQDQSTVAHQAMSRIVHTLGLEPTILTTNHDLGHMARGSRVFATEIRTA